MSDNLSFDLKVQYPDFTLDVAADVPASGITVLSGASGSGKSTLLRSLAGLETRAEGTVRLGDTDWSDLPASGRDIGYVFQDTRLFPHLDVADNLNYGARRRGTSPDKVKAVVAALELEPLMHRDPAHLSGGEARRVALGRALASGPRVLLMDEPLAGLDRARKADLMPYIARAVAGFGRPAIYVTHSTYEVDVLADRVLTIAQGRLTGWGGPAPRLLVRVRRTDGEWVELKIGDVHLWLRGRGEIGETLALPLGEGCLISECEPGRNTGTVTLSGRLVDVENAYLKLEIDGQSVWLKGGATGADWTVGQMVWLTLPANAGPLLTVSDSN